MADEELLHEELEEPDPVDSEPDPTPDPEPDPEPEPDPVPVRESILATVRSLVGVSNWDTAFDNDLILHINGVLMILWQLGIGSKGFFITGDTETWQDFLGDADHLELVKPYVAMKVRLAFDTPTGSVGEALKNLVSEYEYRLNVQAEFSGNLT